MTRNRTGGLEDSGKWDSPSRVPSVRCRSLEEGWALWRDSSTSDSASPISARNSYPPELTSRKVPCQSHARHACSTRHSRRIQLAARSLGLLHTSFVGAKASRGDLTAEGQADSGPLTGFEKVAPSRKPQGQVLKSSVPYTWLADRRSVQTKGKHPFPWLRFLHSGENKNRHRVRVRCWAKRLAPIVGGFTVGSWVGSRRPPAMMARKRISRWRQEKRAKGKVTWYQGLRMTPTLRVSPPATFQLTSSPAHFSREYSPGRGAEGDACE